MCQGGDFTHHNGTGTIKILIVEVVNPSMAVLFLMKILSWSTIKLDYCRWLTLAQIPMAL